MLFNQYAVDVAWRKASGSVGNGECVEVASTGKAVIVRDSKSPDGFVLVYTRQAWQSFTASRHGVTFGVQVR